MSIICLSHIMRHSEAKGGSRLVLFVLAEHAHDDGSDAFPAVDTIVERSRMSRKGVQICLRKLEGEGHISRDGVGPRGQTKWRVHMGGEPRTPRVDDDLGGRTSRPNRGEPRTPEPSIDPLIDEPVREARERAQTPTYSFNGHRVKDEDRQKACDVLAAFNQLAGAALKPFLASGASPELKRVTRAVLDHPDLSADEWRAVIRWTLEHPWWSGTVTIGAVFGPNAVGENIDKWRRRAENGVRPLAIVPSPQQPVRHDRYSEKREREIAREEAAQRVLAARQREDQ